MGTSSQSWPTMLANAGTDVGLVIIIILLVLMALNDWHESH